MDDLFFIRKAVELLRRGAEKPLPYLLKWLRQEAWRKVRAPFVLLKIGRMTPRRLAKRLQTNSLTSYVSQESVTLSPLKTVGSDTLRHLYKTRFVQEAQHLSWQVEKIYRHEFEILGSGPVTLESQIDWHRDFVSGKRWEVTPASGIDYADLGSPSDVKLPWELCRFQHLMDLGRWWLLTQDPRAPEEFQAEVLDWIKNNPVGDGIHWACTMEVALRATSWVWAISFFNQVALPGVFWDRYLVSLYQHGLWTEEHLEESDINGNHYIADALGLVACGFVFRSSLEGRKWLQKGARILEDEIQLQIGKDGVDIEASVPYHRLAVEIFLAAMILLREAGYAVSQSYQERLSQAFDFIHAYITPDGLSPVIGDADDGRVWQLGHHDIRDHRYLLSLGAVLFSNPSWKAQGGKLWEDVVWLLGPDSAEAFDHLPEVMPDGSRAFREAGVYIMRRDNHYLYLDCGGVGLKGRGGHGHNDILSFEWHAFGRPVITDSGSYVYTASPKWRNLFRSTAYHNTIRVDSEEVNRIPSVMSLWRLCNDAQPLDVHWESNAEYDRLMGSHEGYHRLHPGIRITREIVFKKRFPLWAIRDRVTGDGKHDVEIFFHLAPSVKGRMEQGKLQFQWEDGFTGWVIPNKPVRWQLREGWFSPSYGIKVTRESWVAPLLQVSLPVEMTWELRISPSTSQDNPFLFQHSEIAN